MVNTVALLAFDYQFRLKINKQLTQRHIISLNVQLLCNVVFTGDAVLGIVARGLILPSKAYLKDWWNCLSLICVVAT